MNQSNTNADVPVIGKAPNEWKQLTKSPVEGSEKCVFNAQGHFVISEINTEFGPVTIESTGEEIKMLPEISMGNLQSSLNDNGISVSDEEIYSLVEWYRNLVSSVIREDICDPEYKTKFWSEYGYAGSIDNSILADEIRSLDISGVSADEIAKTVESWRPRRDGEPSEILECDFSAKVIVK